MAETTTCGVMHVAINAWFWDQPATGSGQYIRHLLPALATLSPEARFAPVVPVGKEVDCSAPNVVPHKTSGPTFLTSGRFGSRIADLYKLWFEQVVFPRAATAQESDVAHVPYFAAPVRPATPTVVTVHDLIPMVLPAYRGSALVRAYTRVVAAGVRRADAIIADSEWSKRDIIAHLKVDPQRVHVIPLAAGPQFQPATPEEIAGVRARHNLPDRYVLYLGGFDQRKNVPALLHAFARLQAGPDLGLVIAGRLPARDTAFTPDPRRIAARLGIEKSVVFPGWIDERDKPALYSGAELFAFPSTYEGFGLPVLEALACGAPVVTSTSSSLPEVAGDAAITVDPHDVTALVQAMVAVLGDAGRRQAMRKASLVQAGRFSWQRTAEATLQVYRQVLVNRSLSSCETLGGTGGTQGNSGELPREGQVNDHDEDLCFVPHPSSGLDDGIGMTHSKENTMMDDLVQRLERNRDEFMKTAAQLTEDVVGLSLGEDDWTVWGVMAHLTAAEWQLRRMAEIIARKPAFKFESFDRDEMNARSVARYESKPLSEIVEQWQFNRQKMIEFAGSLGPDQLQNLVLHPVYGEIGPVYPIERQIWHVSAHLAEIRGALRRADK